MRFKKYGRYWYTRRDEAEYARRYNERVYHSKEMRAYYIRRPRREKSFWEDILGW